MINRRNLFGLGLLVPVLGLPAMVKAAPAPVLDFETQWLREALIQFVKHYECTQDPRYVYYRCRYHIDELPKIRYAELREFLLEPETNMFAGEGQSTIPVTLDDGRVVHPTRCCHLDFVIGWYKIIEKTDRMVVHRKLPSSYPYDDLAQIALADHLLPVTNALFKERVWIAR